VIDIYWLLILAAPFKAELFVINDEIIAFGTAECTYFLGTDFILTEMNAEERRVKVTALCNNMIIVQRFFFSLHDVRILFTIIFPAKVRFVSSSESYSVEERF